MKQPSDTILICVGRSQCRGGRASRSRTSGGGVAMLLVLIVVAMATVLGTAFLASQTTTTGITRNLEDQAVARQIAESGLVLIKHQILSDPNWRTGRTQGQWVVNQSLGMGTFTASIIDTTDGDPSNKPEDPFTLEVMGTYDNAVHVVRARVQPYVGKGSAGLNVNYYVSATPLSKLSDVDWSAVPSYTETVPSVNRPKENINAVAFPGGPKDNWASTYQGYINIPASGLWTFYTSSDDGSDLLIDGQRIVNNDNPHAWRNKSGTVSLDQGQHTFLVRFFEQAIDQGIVAYWQGPTIATKTVIPATAFTRSSGDDENGQVDNNTITVAVNNSIKMTDDAQINAYSSKRGAYSNATASSRAKISTNFILPLLSVQLLNNARIDGGLYVDPLLNISIILLKSPSSEITKGVKLRNSPVNIPKVEMPDGIPSNEGNVNTYSGNITINSNHNYNNVTLGTSTVYTIDGDVTIWCQQNFKMRGNASLVIPEGSSLTLYVNGVMDLSVNALLNADSTAVNRLKVIMTGQRTLLTPGKDVTIRGNAQAAAIITNHDGGLILQDESIFYGKFLGDSLSMSDQSRIHADSHIGGDDGDDQTTYVFAWDEGL